MGAIQLKRGTASAWAAANTVLALGQPGIETDTRKWKVGDGTTAWNSLSYMSSSAEFIDLTDVPSSYSGQSGKVVSVKNDETGLEFAALPSSVKAGIATLVSGEVTVSADWIDTDWIIVALAQSAPSTAGTNLYADPSDIVAATSFKIKSDDSSDSRTVFWMASAPTEGGGDSGFALQAPGASYLQKDLGSPQTEVWLTFDLAFDSAAITYWQAHPYDVFAALWDNDEAGIEWMVDSGPVWQYFGLGPPFPTVSSPVPVVDTWQHIEYHYRRSDSLWELYIDGSLADSHNVTPGDDLYNMRYVVIGQVYGDGDPDEAGAYYKNIKCGTTREGSEFFSEDFSGDLSAWVVNGSPSIVADPF